MSWVSYSGVFELPCFGEARNLTTRWLTIKTASGDWVGEVPVLFARYLEIKFLHVKHRAKEFDATTVSLSVDRYLDLAVLTEAVDGNLFCIYRQSEGNKASWNGGRVTCSIPKLEESVILNLALKSPMGWVPITHSK